MIPLVSIIIPVFNRAHLIGDTLNSVLCQNFTHWECIVVDDGSTDNTKVVVENFTQKDERFKYIIRPNNRIKNASTCRNIGLENSKGELIQFLDSDDLLAQNKIDEQVKLFQSFPDCSVVTCRWARFNLGFEDAKELKDLDSYKDFSDPLDFFYALSNSMGYFPPHAYLIKKEIIIKSGFWNEFLSLNDDGEFMSRVLSNSENIKFARDTMVFYRIPSGDNLGSYNNLKKVQRGIDSWKLIEAYFEIRFDNGCINFIQKAKLTLLENLRNSFPQLIRVNKDFFKSIQKKGLITVSFWHFFKI